MKKKIDDQFMPIFLEWAKHFRRVKLSGAEHQILWCIWVQTYGWKRRKKDRDNLRPISALDRPLSVRCI